MKHALERLNQSSRRVGFLLVITLPLAGCGSESQTAANPPVTPEGTIAQQIHNDRVQAARERFKVDRVHQGEKRAQFTEAPDSKPAPLLKLDKSEPEFDALHYRVFLDFPGASLRAPEAQGEVQLTFRPLKQLQTLKLGSAKLKIKNVRSLRTLEELRHSIQDQELWIDLGRRYEPSETLTVSIAYQWRGNPDQGLYFAARPGQTELEAIYTQSQAEESKYWFPSNPKPNDKATFESFIRVAAPWVALSNGALLDVEERGGYRTYRWSQRQPMVSYLFVVAAGPFSQVRNRWKHVPVDYYGRAEDLPRLTHALRNTLPMMDYMAELTGIDYPYEKYAQVVLPQYFVSGMEHTTATTLTDDVLHTPEQSDEFSTGVDELVMHELAHHWFGNLTTCKSWDHLWLNEGFAAYFQALYLEKVRKDPDAALESLNEGAEWYFAEEAEDPRPVVFDRYRELLDYYFDSRAYAKGAWILHMLRHELGDDVFFKTLRNYIQLYQGRLVESKDLQEVAESTSGRKLGWFFEQWLDHPGHPVFKTQWSYDASKKRLRIELTQAQDRNRGETGRRPYFQGHLPIEIDGHKRVLWIDDRAKQRLELAWERTPRYVVINSGSAWLAEVETSQATTAWVTQLRHSRDSQARIAAAEALSGQLGSVDRLFECAAQDRAVQVRAACATALGSETQALSAPATQALLTLLRAPQWQVREQAATALAYFPSQGAFNGLSRRVFEDSSPSVQSAAMKALGRMKWPGTFNVAIDAAQIKTQEELLLRAALQALGSLADPRAVEIATQAALGPYHRGARKQAIALLGQLQRLDGAAYAAQRSSANRALKQALKQERDILLRDEIAALLK